ncbi:hypothetical protein TNCV_1030751 [Trichonephila clavipes]|nr:hypothetical protein TNCV_1030751 [Trichonephila clavipes]
MGAGEAGSEQQFVHIREPESLQDENTNTNALLWRDNPSGLILVFSSKENLQKVMSRRKQRSAFDQVSEFDRGRKVAYRDCGLSFWEINSRVGRNQTTVTRICDR